MKLTVLQKVVFSWIRTHASGSTCNRKQCNINARFSHAKKPEIVSLRGMLRKNCLWTSYFTLSFLHFSFLFFPFSFLPSSLLPAFDGLLFPSLHALDHSARLPFILIWNLTLQIPQCLLNILLCISQYDTACDVSYAIPGLIRFC